MSRRARERLAQPPSDREQERRMIERVARGEREPYLEGYTRAREAVSALHPDAGLDWVWGTMVYACRDKSPGNPAGCGHERRVFLGLGVEGPATVRSAAAYVPCPMFAGRCPLCGGALLHVDWWRDEEFAPRSVPPGVPYFRVPTAEKAVKLASDGYGGGELVEPGDGSSGA